MRLSRDDNSLRVILPSWSLSMSLNAWTSSKGISVDISDQSPDVSSDRDFKTLVGVPRPSLQTLILEEDESDELEDDVVPDPKDGGSDRDTDGLLFDLKIRFGLIFINIFMVETDTPQEEGEFVVVQREEVGRLRGRKGDIAELKRRTASHGNFQIGRAHV